MLNQTTASIEQVSHAVSEIASGTTDQAHQANEGVAKSEELKMSIETVKQNADKMLNMTVEMQENNQNGKLSIDSLLVHQQTSKKSVDEIYQMVQNLGEKIQNVREFTTIISGIADQTNLLALNASIEAARAGESGKGFAVVASQVRKLAEESQKSSLNIQEIIEAIANVAQLTISVAKELTGNFIVQNQSVETTSEVFSKIGDSINSSVERINEVHKHIQVLDHSKGQVLSALTEISSVTEETAASTEEVSASIEEQTASMLEINNRMMELSKATEELKNNIARFKLS
ncbi:methyl-accepting chemotaxis protein [Bacillus sp. CGMCC 1.16607]|uniref:methyl-accepting chemotaxis protein n=1 Tax=Bacillus sp. CGMCC 1.16607 TaxID=3351842 RepID=UPI00363DE450